MPSCPAPCGKVDVTKILVVHEDLERHREYGEEHIAGQVQPEEDPGVEADLESVVALEHLNQDPPTMSAAWNIATAL